MNIQEVINNYQNIIIQIASRTGTGSGFYLKDYNLIVTNKHVVGDNAEVVISGKIFPQVLSKVLFNNARYDVAFLVPPDGIDFPSAIVAAPNTLKDGDEVVAIGHPYGLSYTATSGIVSKSDRLHEGTRYIQIDAAINPGNSGGALINMQGEIVGMNTFIIKGGDNLGFALPVEYIVEDLENYKPFLGQFAIRCDSCGAVVTAQTLDSDKYCPSCGVEINMPQLKHDESIILSNVAKIIESGLSKLSYDPKLCRRGINSWALKINNAFVTITYGQQTTGAVVMDAYLSKIPKQDIAPLYKYMLNECYKPETFNFSIKNQDIILSAIQYDTHLTEENADGILRDFLEKVNEYYNILIEQYGAIKRDLE